MAEAVQGQLTESNCFPEAVLAEKRPEQLSWFHSLCVCLL